MTSKRSSTAVFIYWKHTWRDSKCKRILSVKELQLQPPMFHLIKL